MERRRRTPAAARLALTLAGAAAAALLSAWAASVEWPGALAWLPDATLRAQEPPARAPVYTNDDLERVRPLRAQTGVASQPAFASGAGACRIGRGAGRGRSRRAQAGACADGEGAGTGVEPSPAAAGRAAGARGEAYWRREAERVRDKLRVWRQQIEDLELRIADRRRKPGVRPYSDPQIIGWQRRAEALRARMRELEGDLDDRARRERALPGWLR
jgi:hypothetical protein